MGDYSYLRDIRVQENQQCGTAYLDNCSLNKKKRIRTVPYINVVSLDTCVKLSSLCNTMEGVRMRKIEGNNKRMKSTTEVSRAFVVTAAIDLTTWEIIAPCVTSESKKINNVEWLTWIIVHQKEKRE